MSEIRNKVAESGLITLDPESLLPNEERVEFDLKDFLWQGMVLKESEFRQSIKDHMWETYEGKNVFIHCSEDAIIPHWAYMLVESKLSGLANKVVYGNQTRLNTELIIDNIENLDLEEYRDARVMIKGCGDEAFEASVYMALVDKLQPVVKTLMYGEPCGAVPVYKKPRNKS